MTDPPDRLPPHSIESEMCLIGSLIMGGAFREVLTEVFATVRGEDFFQEDHRVIFNIIADLHRANEPIDAMLIRERLMRANLLDDIGGTSYLAEILNCVPNYANATYYAGIVREKSLLRSLIRIANDSIRAAFAPSREDRSVHLLRKLADAATALAADGVTDDIVSLGAAAVEVLERQDRPEVRRVPTGLEGLDGLLGGLAKSKMCLVGADPRVGKSTLIKQILLNLSRRGVRCGLVTVEEDRGKVAENMLANASQQANHAIAHGNLSHEGWAKVARAAASFGDVPYFIDDGQSQIDDVVASIERLKTKHGCEVVGVDHLHLIKAKGETPEREVSNVSKALKAAFKRCDVAGLVACQLNRGADVRQKPTLRSLRGSGSLEADGDVIMLLYRRDVVEYQDAGFVPDRRIEVNSAKKTDGRMGEVPLGFSGEHQAIFDVPLNDPFI